MEENRGIGAQIELMGYVDRVLFAATDSSYKIIAIKPSKFIAGKDEVKLTKYGNFTIKGNAPSDLSRQQEYKIILERQEDDKKFGRQFRIKYIGAPVNSEETKDAKVFLSSILTESQYESLFDTLDNPLVAIESHDIELLTTCKGIGVSKAKAIIKKYEETKDYSMAYVELFEYGLSDKLIEKLVDAYMSPQIAIDNVKKHPYSLVSMVDGIGFKTADEIAIKGGIPLLSKERVGAYMFSFLKEQAYQGNSWVTPQVLFGNLISDLGFDETDPKVHEAIRNGLYSLEVDNLVVYNDKKTRISLKKVVEIEKQIAEHLIRLKKAKSRIKFDNWEEKIKETERFQGWEFTEQQLEGIETVLNSNVVMISGLGGCVDKDTEYFNGVEWKPIKDYTEGEKVLQYSPERVASLVSPSRYVKVPEKHFSKVQSKNNKTNQRLSWEHNVVYETSKGNLVKRPFYEIVEKNNKNKYGFEGKFLTTFSYNLNKESSISNEVAKLMAVTIRERGKAENHYNNYSIELRLEGNKSRLESLLKETDIGYLKEIRETDKVVYRFTLPMKIKDFVEQWYNLSNSNYKEIVEELKHWGSNYTAKEIGFNKVSKEVADFIQFAFATQGYRASIIENKENFNVIIDLGSSKIRLSTGKEKVTFEVVPSLDGYKYCFEVPSGMLVLRRDNKIFITGNTGKTSIVSGMLDVLEGYTSIQGALSGKASARLAEVTGQEGYTIHRMLGYNPKEGFAMSQKNPLPYDIIIIDELSMVGADIFLPLLKAIESGSKLIVISDVGQLEAIGLGNVATDIIESEVIDVSFLTQIHRQAQKSDIVKKSIDIRQGIQIAEKPGRYLEGELQDLEIVVDEEKDQLFDKIIDFFKKDYEELEGEIMDIQVVVPMKTRGDLSTLNINRAIQEIVNPKLSEKDKFLKVEEPPTIIIKGGRADEYELRLGDKVINTKNSYDTENEEGEECPVFNGDTGIITEINLRQKYVKIDFIRVGIVLIPLKNIQQIELAYALTAHKCISGDTWIKTNKGLKQLKELDNGAKVGELKPYKGSLKVYNGFEYVKPKAFYNQGYGATREIITQRGYRLNASTGHGCLIMREDKKIKKVLAHELKEGDLIFLNIGGEIGELTELASRTYNTKEEGIKHQQLLLAQGVLTKLEETRDSKWELTIDKIVKSDTPYLLERIARIDEKVGNTYCLEMGEQDTFVQNGMLMYNCQGSESKRVIVGLDYSAYMLLSREWVYTAITRAKKHCTLVAELSALKQAIRTSKVSKKQTYLKEFLRYADEHLEEMTQEEK